MATPTTHARTVEITSRAWAEARSMAGVGPDRDSHPQRDCLAAALRAHSALSAGLGHCVPVTALGPTGGAVRGLAAFLAVYADQDRHRRTTPDQDRSEATTPDRNRGEDATPDRDRSEAATPDRDRGEDAADRDR
ncbi:hypothetical protein AB0M97_26825 [Streptomyces sp. NPDC051207]|uniref:hypothetical protein n=1 Tax=Streptomyces sp. NPDC051207 TaxID=3154641 RepID=UPI00342094DA